jgi:feruloyl esterase
MAAGLATVLAAAALAGAVASGAPGAAAVTAGTARVRPVVACGHLASPGYNFGDIPDAPTYILSASQSGSGAGAVCHVTGYIAPQEQFQLALPVSTYTGQYLQSGCGGLCGWSLPSASAGPEAAAAGCPAAAALAAASGGQMAGGTDNQGHVGGENDALWAKQDPALRVSFGYASEHALAQAAKTVIAAYYGKPPAYSYYEGCSGGGHEALTEAQRYPGDFNGILAGAPGSIQTEGLSVVPAWLIAVNAGAHGREILGSDKLPALHAAVLKACANAQGLIEDPRSCGFNPATLRCPPGVNTARCLTTAQVRVVRDFYLGPHDGRGHYFYPGGEPYGSELAWGGGTAIDPSSDRRWPRDTKAYQAGESWLRYAAYWRNPPDSFQLTDFRFTMASYRKLLPLAGVYDATDPDLSAFQRAGGKLIIWQGWDDQELSPFGTVDYYRAVARHGGLRESQAFSRLYMIPDQYHCLTGGFPVINGQRATADLMASLVRWVEHGTAPRGFSFPLAHPAGGLRAITVRPLDPLRPPAGGARGLNTRYRWVGRFVPGAELWCRTSGMDLTCGHRRPPIAYSPGARRSRQIR